MIPMIKEWRENMPLSKAVKMVSVEGNGDLLKGMEKIKARSFTNEPCNNKLDNAYNIVFKSMNKLLKQYNEWVA